MILEKDQRFENKLTNEMSYLKENYTESNNTVDSILNLPQANMKKRSASNGKLKPVFFNDLVSLDPLNDFLYINPRLERK